jgi:O-antigen/teichoic acid export membrane protein
MKFNTSLVGSAGIYLGANVLNAGVPFLLMPVLTRVLSPADYGTIAMFGIVLSIVGAFTGLSVHGAISVRYFQLEKSQLAEYIGACATILVASTALVVVAILLLGSRLVDVTGLSLDWLLVAAVVSGLQFLANIRLVLYQVTGKAANYGIFQFSQTLLNAGISLVLILAVGLAWEGRLIGQAVAIAMFGAGGAVLMLKDGFIRRPSNLRATASDALKFGLPLVPHTLGALLIVAVDRFVIVRYLDMASAGIYMIALQMGQVVGLLTDSFNKAYAPWLMKKLAEKDKAPRHAIVRGTYVYFAAVVLIAATIGGLAPWFLPYLVGASFAQAGEFVIYMTMGFAFGGSYYMVTNYLFFESKTAVLAVITAVAGVINIPMTIWLVKINGLEGAAQAFMLTQLLSFVGTWWVAQKAHPMPWLRAVAGSN